MYCFIWNIDYPTVSQKLNLRSCGRKSRSNWPSCWGGFELTLRKTQSRFTASHHSLRFCFPPIQSYLRYFQQPSTRIGHIYSFHSFSRMFILSLKHCTAGRQSFSPKNQFIRQKKGKDKKRANRRLVSSVGSAPVCWFSTVSNPARPTLSKRLDFLVFSSHSTYTFLVLVGRKRTHTTVRKE